MTLFYLSQIIFCLIELLYFGESFKNYQLFGMAWFLWCTDEDWLLAIHEPCYYSVKSSECLAYIRLCIVLMNFVATFVLVIRFES